VRKSKDNKKGTENIMGNPPSFKFQVDLVLIDTDEDIQQDQKKGCLSQPYIQIPPKNQSPAGSSSHQKKGVKKQQKNSKDGNISVVPDHDIKPKIPGYPFEPASQKCLQSQYGDPHKGKPSPSIPEKILIGMTKNQSQNQGEGNNKNIKDDFTCSFCHGESPLFQIVLIYYALIPIFRKALYDCKVHHTYEKQVKSTRNQQDLWIDCKSQMMIKNVQKW
jgi:hypothetical protein